MTNTSPLTDWQGSITIFKSFTGTRPNTELVDVSWDEVVNTIKPNSPTVLEDKTKGQCFLPCALKDAPLIGTTLALAEEEGESTVGKMRSKQHVTPANILVIDIDGISKSNLDLASEKMKHDDVTFLAYTTFSQGLKTDMRVRLALPLDRAITVEEYPTAWHGFDALYFKGEIGELDPSGAKLYQQQALWCCHPERLDQADSWETRLVLFPLIH
jgi:hypothetical protein